MRKPSFGCRSTAASLLLLWLLVSNNHESSTHRNNVVSLWFIVGADAWLLQRHATTKTARRGVGVVPLVLSSRSASTSSTIDNMNTNNDVVVDKAEIIGGGRIGSLLAEAGNAVVLGRNDKINPDDVGIPILIATRNDSLEDIIDECPNSRKKDLVFMQNGYLDKFLESKGLLDNTQVLLYLAVTAKGATPIDGITTTNPEGLTAATGIHAIAFAKRLNALNLKCVVKDSIQDYRSAMFEKLIWISTYMLVGTAKGCSSVGQAGKDHKELVEQVINELMQGVISKEQGLTFPPGTIERLCAYTDVVTDFPCGVKEFEWRNQYFYKLGDDICPIHNNLLRDCATNGFLGFELP